MAFTQADLDAINEAIASGAVEVEYADKKVRYRSLDDMKRVRTEIENELSPNGRRCSRRYGVYYKNR